MKQCSKCKVDKPYDSFALMKGAFDGLQGYCKDCQREYQNKRSLIYRECNKNKKLSKGIKDCSKCRKTKPYNDFYRNNSKASGFNSECKECGREQRLELSKRYYHKNRDYYLERSNKYYRENKEKILDRMKTYRQENNIALLMKKYGADEDYYYSLLELQSNSCAICGESEKKLVVDHCHICGFSKLEAVRGLLCQGCNGHFNFSLDNSEILRKAIEYSDIHSNKYHRYKHVRET